MDRIEDLLHRIRDPRACADLLLSAQHGDARGVAGQLAAVLSALPAAHRELDQGASLPGAGQGAMQPRDMKEVALAQPVSFERVASLVLLALLCTTAAGLA